VARDVATRARARGIGAAAVDLDDIVFMVAGTDWRTVTAAHWSVARRVVAPFVDALFMTGSRIVIVAGPWFGKAERRELVDGVRTRASLTVVALTVDLHHAVDRAAGDPTRTLSKDPAFLAQIEKTIDWTELPADVITVATDGLSAEEVGARVLSAVLD
jgi:hypothetical protein